MIIPAEQVRDELRRRVGLLPDETWGHLREKGIVAKIQRGRFTIEQGADLVEKILRTAGRYVERPKGDQPRFVDPDGVLSDLAREKRKPSTRRERNPDLRQEALSCLLADVAAEDPGVVAFRQAHLGDELLAWERVEGWLKRQAEQDGPASTWLRALLPDDHKLGIHRGQPYPDPAMEISRNRPGVGFTRAALRYAAPDSRWTRTILIRQGGVLDQLRYLSERLAKRYNWLDAAATVFVLTGGIPAVDRILLQVRAHQEPSASSRIELVVDPTVKPAELAQFYADFRSKLVSKRHRTQSKKHLTLAIFSTTRPKGQTWKDQLRKWNKQYGRLGRYRESDVANFGKDVRQARARLLGSAPGRPLDQTWFEKAISAPELT